MKESQIKAVHQRDLRKLLKSLGVYEAVHSKAESCFFCSCIIDEERISAVFPYGEEVCFCCGKPECCSALIDFEQEDEYG
jgi:hypothetical protein